MRVLGIMSGTSLDGVDYAICSFTDSGEMDLREHWHVPFPARLRERLFAAASNHSSAHQVAQLHHDLGRFYACGAAGAKVQLAGLHGQTIFHRPHRTAPATFQLGEPAYLAEVLRIPVISNFRAADLAAGGQGAPLASIFHQRVFARKGLHIAVNNLGGISNVTSLDWRLSEQPRLLAFDTGPGNMLIDLAVARITRGRRAFDRNGLLARKGRIAYQPLERWLKHRYFKKLPSKSTGREMFGADFLDHCARDLSGPDLLATLTEFTARSIALNYKLHLPEIPREVILCGGGAENPFLVERIAEALQELRPDAEVKTSHDYGWPPQLIEPAAFALLAWLRSNRQPANLPQTTGATHPCLLGQLSETHLS